MVFSRPLRTNILRNFTAKFGRSGCIRLNEHNIWTKICLLRLIRKSQLFLNFLQIWPSKAHAIPKTRRTRAGLIRIQGRFHEFPQKFRTQRQSDADLQPFIHHMRIDHPQTWVIERIGNGANGVKAQAVPEPQRTGIAGQHEIELHGRVTQRPRLILAMGT